jgi:hypothetical protein
LIIEYIESLEKINHQNIERQDSTIIRQKMFLKDIDSIEMDININKMVISDSMYTTTTAIIYINAQREYSLFKKSYNNKFECNTAFVDVPIYRHSDTTNFRNIIKILKAEAKKRYKALPPNCLSTKIMINKKGDYVEGVKLNSIEEFPILNDSSDVTQNLNLLVSNYIENKGIGLLEGFVVIDSTDQPSKIYIYQEYMSSQFNQEIKINASELTNKIYGFKIRQEQFASFREMLKDQNWKAGKCNGEKVNTLIEYSSDFDSIKLK